MKRLDDYYKLFPEKKLLLHNLLAKSKQIDQGRKEKIKDRLLKLEEMRTMYYGKRS